MTMDSLREIRMAEEKAEKIRHDAAEEAKARIARAHVEAERIVSEADAEAHREAAATVADITRKADSLVAAGAETARKDAAAIETDASRNADEAVKMIYWEIVEKCLRA